MDTLKLDSRKRRRVENCPCGRSNKDGKFVPYIGFENCGFCHSCGETYLPKLDKDNRKQVVFEPIKPKPIDYYPRVEFEQYRRLKLTHCSFVQSLYKCFRIDIRMVKKIIANYRLTVDIKDRSKVIFWQIDVNGNIRYGKAMAYNATTGKRIKTINPYYLSIKGLNLKRCFFGEHLINKSTKPIGIVESEKTAVLMSVIVPELIWIATGGKHFKWSNLEVYKALFGRSVILFPDLGEAYLQWLEAKKTLQRQNIDVKISKYLETISNDLQKEQGLDLADFL